MVGVSEGLEEEIGKAEGMRLRKYEMGRTLGEGKFVKVKFSKNLDSGQPFTVKILEKSKILDLNISDQGYKRRIVRSIMPQHTDSMAQDTNRRLKIIAGADSFGCALKDTLVNHLRSLNIDVEDLGTDKYYSVGEEIGRRVSSAATTNTTTETRGLVACGTGVGVSIFANKFPGVYAATCLTAGEAQNSRSINNSNVLAVSGMSTSPDSAIEILNTWLNTPFKSPCPASDSKPWPPEIDSFLENSVREMSTVGIPKSISDSKPCAICSLTKNREFAAIDEMPGASMQIVRETPTTAFVRFKAGSVEPAHHHTFGHDVVVVTGKKKVWNLSKGEEYDLAAGDFLFTPAGDVHRVKYWEDTEFYIKWEGLWDILMDEDFSAAHSAIDKETNLVG